MVLKIIGRKEWVDLPRLGLHKIEAKVDTGAFTSSLHCENIKENKDSISCQFLNNETLSESHSFSTFNKRKVKSSNGIEELRYVIWTEIIIDGEKFEIELTLTDRNEMKAPLLLGRKFIRKKYLVDVSKKNMLKK